MFVGFRCFAYYQKWNAVNRNFPAVKPQPATLPAHFTSPIPDPDSDIIFVNDGRGMTLVRFSPEKGFWGEEPKITNSAGTYPAILLKGCVVIVDQIGREPNVVSFDVTADRPWPATAVIPIGHNIMNMAFQQGTGRIFLASDKQIDVFRVSGKAVSRVGSIATDFGAAWVYTSPDERYLYACSLEHRCFLLHVPDGVGQPVGTPAKALPLKDFVYKLAFTPDGNLAVSIDHEDETKISVYRVAATGEFTPVAGSPFPAQHHSTTLFVSPLGNAIYLGYEPWVHAPGVHSSDITRGLDIYSLDPKGRATLMSSMRDGPQFLRFGMFRARAFGQAGSGPVFVYDVDEQTGLLKQIASSHQPFGHMPFVMSSEKEFPPRRGLPR